MTRGDVFLQPEDDYQEYYDFTNATARVPTLSTPEATVSPVDEQASTDDYAWTEEKWFVGPTEETPRGPTEGPTLPGEGEGEEEEESLCSGKPFDAFTSLKNGSIFAFRGSPAGGATPELPSPGAGSPCPAFALPAPWRT